MFAFSTKLNTKTQITTVDEILHQRNHEKPLFVGICVGIIPNFLGGAKWISQPATVSPNESGSHGMRLQLGTLLAGLCRAE